MKYYRLRDDINVPGRWYLGDIMHVDNWLYRNPPIDFMESSMSTMKLYKDGDEIDFTLTERYSVPIVSEDFVFALAGIEEVDQPFRGVIFNEVSIVGKSSFKKYFTMAIETQVDCIDESRSEFKKFEVNDPVRPDLAGEYSAFYKLVLNSDKIKNVHLFRLKKYLSAIIVSGEVKSRLELSGITGVVFEVA